jgi:Integrase core domain
MVTDRLFRRLRKLIQTEGTLANAADKAGIDEKTARKYRDSDSLPSQVAAPHTWRTREDPFQDVWPETLEMLRLNPGLQAKTLFLDLQRRFPGRFPDGQLRTLQRRIKSWRATEGPPKEVFFAQTHHPGRLCASDFTHMTELGVTIAGDPFDHLVYHFVLTYSNWETGTVCFSESWESLCDGLQDALWERGGVPRQHRTDRLSAAVKADPDPERFPQRYQALMAHYGLKPQAIAARQAHQNGDVEQSHHRFKQAVDQALMLRGGRDFASRRDYEASLRRVMAGRNANRRERFAEEQSVLSSLPARRPEMRRRVKARVDSGSAIHVGGNTYSVSSRLIGEWVEVHIGAEVLEVWYGARRVDRLPRLRGRGKHRIEYRHIIDWLVRKPAAFEEYRYRDAMFPTSRFRMAYDALKERAPSVAAAEYLAILHLAALEGESLVDEALRWLLDRDQAPASEAVAGFVREGRRMPPMTDVTVAAVDLAEYDRLLTRKEDEDLDPGQHERAIERLPQGVVPADDARQLRGAGPPRAAGVAQL